MQGYYCVRVRLQQDVHLFGLDYIGKCMQHCPASWNDHDQTTITRIFGFDGSSNNGKGYRSGGASRSPALPVAFLLEAQR
jgi:hypothetical protein